MTKYVENKLKAHGFKNTGTRHYPEYTKLVQKYLLYKYDVLDGSFSVNLKVRGYSEEFIKSFPTLRKFLQSLENAKFVI